MIIKNKKIAELLNSFWDGASNYEKGQVKKYGDYSYYSTIRSALRRGAFSERMINSFMKVMKNNELNEIFEKELND